MLRKYAILLAGCAVLLLAGCGSDNSTTDTKAPNTQQEVQKDTSAGAMQKDHTENEETGVEKAMPEENLKKGTSQEEEEKGEGSMKEDMDKTMPEKNTFKENYPVTDGVKI